MSSNAENPIVEEVLRFEDLPPDSLASRRAIVRWSDGSEGEAIRFYSDEILSPVDRVGGAEAGLNAGNPRREHVHDVNPSRRLMSGEPAIERDRPVEDAWSWRGRVAAAAEALALPEPCCF
jgi:hypothetical protein